MRILNKPISAIIMLIILITSSCNLPKAETEENLNQVRTQAVETVMFELTLEGDAPDTVKLPEASATPAPSPTLQAQPSTTLPVLATAAIQLTPTWTPPPKDYQAELVSQQPEDFTYFKAEQEFNAFFTFKNTGSRDWTKSFYIRHKKGPKLSLKEQYTLPAVIHAGETGQAIANMKAPTDPGPYIMYWELVTSDGTPFYTFYIIVNVKK
jgi:hypothetical protein